MNALAMFVTCGIHQDPQAFPDARLPFPDARLLVSVFSTEPRVYTGDQPYWPEEDMGDPVHVRIGAAETEVPIP